MAINVFEGARRMGLVAAFLWIIACIIFSYNNSTKVARFYTIASPVAKPVPNTLQACGEGDATYFTDRSIAHSGNVQIVLCFTSYTVDGKKLIPFAEAKEQDTQVWRQYSKPNLDEKKIHEMENTILEMDRREPVDIVKIKKLIAEYVEYRGEVKRWIAGNVISNDVLRYTTIAGAKFQIPEDDIPAAHKALWENHLTTAGWTLAFIFGGLLLGWTVMKTVGWIVRGFAGIPRDKDFKES